LLKNYSRSTSSKLFKPLLRLEVWRSDAVRLLPTSEQEELLRRIAEATRTLANREHKRRQVLYEKSGHRVIDAGIKHAYWNQDYAELKELIGTKNFNGALKNSSGVLEKLQGAAKAEGARRAASVA
jgi:hypothetical protein